MYIKRVLAVAVVVGLFAFLVVALSLSTPPGDSQGNETRYSGPMPPPLPEDGDAIPLSLSGTLGEGNTQAAGNNSTLLGIFGSGDHIQPPPVPF